MIYSYYFTVFNSSSIYLLRHLVVLGALRRNQSVASFFRLFRGLFCVSSAYASFASLEEKVCDSWVETCDLGSCDGCDNNYNSGYYNKCEGRITA